MGTLMGSRAQVWTGNLVYHNQANRGQIIVRAEAIQASNMVAEFSMRMQGVNNLSGGCMGMCKEPAQFTIEI